MTLLRTALALITSILLGGCQSPEPATSLPTTFLKKGDDQTGSSLQTSINSFEKDGTTITFFALIHVAEEGYYESISSKLTSFDRILFEELGRVTEPRAEVRANAITLDPLAEIAKTLGLSSQRDALKLNGPAFIHADLSRRELESLKADGQVTRNPAIERQPEMVEAILNGDKARLRSLLAERILTADGALNAADQPHFDARNEKCLKVLDELLATKPGTKSIAILYGASHGPALTKGITSRGFTPTATRWITAWN